MTRATPTLAITNATPPVCHGRLGRADGGRRLSTVDTAVALRDINAMAAQTDTPVDTLLLDYLRRRGGAVMTRKEPGGGQAWGTEVLNELLALNTSMRVDDRDDTPILKNLNRYPMGVSGIDWQKHPVLHSASTRKAEDVRMFVTESLVRLDVPRSSRALVLLDNIFDELLAIPVAFIADLAAQLQEMQTGFFIGPESGEWEWIIDIRFAGSAHAGRATP